MSKIKIPYAEFYIINVCNLACPGCNRFNNYNFVGYQRWADYADVYAQWAKEFAYFLEPKLLEWLSNYE